MTEIDLAEFVSDYWQMYRDGSIDEKPTADEIANAYQDTTGRLLDSGQTEALIRQIKYYLP